MRPMRYVNISVALISSIVLSTSASAQTAFVRVDGDQGSPFPPGFGGGWGGNAYKFLQDALARAQFLLINGVATDVEIWVARTGLLVPCGLVPCEDSVDCDPNPYRPDRNAANPVGTGARNATFQLNNSVALYGGFLGTDNPQGPETDRDQRNFLANLTVLSGDLFVDDVTDCADALACYSGVNTPHQPGCDSFDLDNDGDVDAGDLNMVENSYNVVSAGDLLDQTAILNGFTVRGGHANGSSFQSRGAGIVCKSGPAIVNCIITCNLAVIGIGGNGGNGGGLFFRQNSTALVTNCLITDNVAERNGGGIARGLIGELETFSGMDVSNSLIARNRALGDGGGFWIVENPGLDLTNCTIANNEAKSRGGGYFEQDQIDNPQDPTAPPTVMLNTILWDNAPGQIHLMTEVRLSVDFSDVKDGEGGVGGDTTNLTWGIHNIESDPFFEDPGNGNYRLKCPSAARNTATGPPQDEQDVDDDGDTTEKTPDHDLNFRVVPAAVGGCFCNNAVADMGSFESHSDCPPGDCASPGVIRGEFGPPDGVVDNIDLMAVNAAMGLPGGPCDVSPECSGDGCVNVLDFIVVLTHLGEQCGGGGIPGGSGGWGDWQSEPWVYGLLYAHGLSDWDDFNAWVPEADLNELGAFLDTLMLLLTAGQ